MKNDESNEYSKAAEVINEKKSQILKHSTSCHANDHAAEKSDCHDDEHESRQEYVVHVADIMFDRADDDDCSICNVQTDLTQTDLIVTHAQ